MPGGIIMSDDDDDELHPARMINQRFTANTKPESIARFNETSMARVRMRASRNRLR
jgi:hypothetical protein